MDALSNDGAALCKCTSANPAKKKVLAIIVSKSSQLLATAFQLIGLGLARHLDLGNCRHPTGPGPSIHPITLPISQAD